MFYKTGIGVYVFLAWFSIQLEAQSLFWEPSTGPSGGNIQFIKELDDGTLFAGTSGNGLFRRERGGSKWIAVGMAGEQVNALAVGGTIFYAGTADRGVWISLDQGESWQETSGNGVFGGHAVLSLATNGNVVYAGLSAEGVWRSDDGGSTWISARDGLPAASVLALMYGANALYAGLEGEGALRSDDGGRTWGRAGLFPFSINTLALQGELIYAGAGGEGVFSTDTGGLIWSEAGLEDSDVRVLAVKGDLIYAATGREGVFSLDPAVGDWTPLGLAGRSVQALAVTDNSVLAGMASEGVLRRQAGRDSWEEFNQELTNTRVEVLLKGANTLYAGTANRGIFRTDDAGLTWVGMGLADQEIITILEADSSLLVGTADGVFRSEDRGKTWIPLGLRGLRVGALVSDIDLLLAGVVDGGLFRSEDEGANWRLSGLLGLQVEDLVLDGRTVYAATHNGVFRSDNRGLAWSSMGLSGQRVSTLSVVDETFYASTQADGLFFSDTGGLTWSPLGLEEEQVTGVVTSGIKLFAATSRGVWLSEDVGRSWFQVNTGLRDRQVGAVLVLDQRLYAATRSGGVQRSTELSDDNLRVHITAVDAADFPDIKVALTIVDSQDRPARGIGIERIGLSEEGTGVNPGEFTEFATGGPVAVDLVFVLDNTSSMVDEIAEVKFQVGDFVRNLRAREMDVAMGLVSYKDRETVHLGGRLTEDIGEFQREIDELTPSGGINVPENALPALAEAARDMQYRDQSQRVMILVSDASFHNTNFFGGISYGAVVNLLLRGNITLHVVGPSNTGGYDINFGASAPLPTATGGNFYDILSGFPTAFSALVETLSSFYLLSYRSPRPTLDGSTRQVVLRAGVGRDTTSYTIAAQRVLALRPERETANAGAAASFVIELDDGESIAGGDLTIEYDVDILEPLIDSVQPGEALLEANILLVANFDTPGQVRFSMAGSSSALQGESVLFSFAFNVHAAVPVGTVAEVRFTRAELRDERTATVPVRTEDGQVRIEESEFLGDVNFDGTVNSGDAILLLRFSAGLQVATERQNRVGDVNRDGGVDAGDGILVLRFSAGLIQTFPNVQAKILMQEGEVVEDLILRLGEIRVASGTRTAIVPIVVQGGQKIAGGDLLLTYGASGITAKEVREGPLATAAGMIVLGNTSTRGTVKIAMAGTAGLAANGGVLAEVHFDILPVLGPGQYELVIAQAVLRDEGAQIVLPQAIIDGHITIIKENDAFAEVGDFDGDGQVGFGDFFRFTDSFGAQPGEDRFAAELDLDGDGVIGFGDLFVFIDNFGKPTRVD
jgi:Mg-chelatase subunit ChlD